MAREWLGGEGRSEGTAWQMHNRVLFWVPSDLADWPTLVEWPREIVCVWTATSNKSWWVLSEGIGTKRVKCLVSNLARSAFCPSSHHPQGCSSCLTRCAGISLMRGIKKPEFSTMVVRALHSQVDDSPPWCSVAWMFCLPLAPLLTHITQYSSVVFSAWEQVKSLELSGSQRSGFRSHVSQGTGVRLKIELLLRSFLPWCCTQATVWSLDYI